MAAAQHAAAPRLAVFAGSTRTESLNKKLAALAAAAARTEGAEVTAIDLRDFAMPLYDGDVEAHDGVPEPARRLKQLLRAQDGFVIACPEYNGSIPGVLKNAIDWVSRREGDEPPLVAYRGKVAGLLSASPGRLGGARALITLRHVLAVMGSLVVPTQFSLPHAAKAFDADGALAEASAQAAVEAVAREVVDTARRMSAGAPAAHAR